MSRPTLLLVLLSGCLHAATMPVNLVSRAEFPPADREQVWSRALVALQELAPIASVEGPAQVATTAPHGGAQTCRKSKCEVTGVLQVIVTPTGAFSARYNRTFSGEVDMAYSGSYERLLLEEDVARLQYQLDDWVAEVVGGKAAPAAATQRP